MTRLLVAIALVFASSIALAHGGVVVKLIRRVSAAIRTIVPASFLVTEFLTVFWAVVNHPSCRVRAIDRLRNEEVRVSVGIEMHRAMFCVLVACSNPVEGGPTPSVKSPAWNVESTGNRIGPTSISWVANGKTVWTKSIPKPLRFTIFDDGWAGKAKAWLAKQRDEDGYAKYWAIATLPGAIAIGDNGTLLVLDVTDGHTLFEQTIDLDRGNSFSGALFDSGDIEVTGKATCKLHVAQKQNFVLACGDVLVAHDRGFVSVIDTRSWKLVEKVEWRGPTSDELRGDCPGLIKTDVDRTKKVGGWTIHAKGVRATFCMN